MNWFMVWIGALGTTALRYLAGHLFKKPAEPLAQVKALFPAPVMLESFEAMLCRRGISIRSARALVAAGFDSFATLEKASDVELLAIKGVGPETVKKIRSFLQHNHQFEGEPA
jgi:hypothetical protein